MMEAGFDGDAEDIQRYLVGKRSNYVFERGGYYVGERSRRRTTVGCHLKNLFEDPSTGMSVARFFKFLAGFFCLKKSVARFCQLLAR
jgi:hypothetical protein